MRQNNRLRLVLIAVSIFLTMVALGFSGWITIVTFQKNYIDSLAASYQVVAQSAKRNIEYAVRYGKPLNNFAGMEQLLGYVKDNVPELENARVIQPDGKILYDLSGPVKNKQLPAAVVNEIKFDSAPNGVRSYARQYAAEHHFFIPLRDKDGVWIGTLDFSVSDSHINSHVARYSWTVIQDTVVIGIISLNFMVFLLFAIPLLDDQGKIRRSVLIAIVGCIFGLAQLSYSALNIGIFQQAYISTAQSNIEIMAKSIKSDVDGVIAKGIPYAKLSGLDEYLSQIISSSPGIERIVVETSDGKVKYQAAAARSDEYLWANPVEYSRELIADKNGVSGRVQVGLSDFYIAGKIKHILTDSLIIAVVFFLLFYEVFRFVPFAWQKSVHAAAGMPAAAYNVRVFAYLLFIAAGMGLAIMPMFATAGSGAAALVMQFAGASGAIGYGRRLLAKLPWRSLLYVAMATIGAGVVCGAALAGDYATLAAWGLLGGGYGLAWLACRAYMAAGPAAQDGRSLQFLAGMLGGTLCGTAVGNLLEDRSGIVGTGIAMLVLFAAAAAFAASLDEGERPEKQSVTAGISSCLWAQLPLLCGLTFIYGNLAHLNIFSVSYLAALLALVAMTMSAKGR